MPEPQPSDNIEKSEQDSEATSSDSAAEYITQFEQFSGPLPPPEVLEKYEQIYPGAIERIFSMVEGQASHRKSLETKQLELIKENNSRQWNEARLGQILGFFIGIFFITGAVIIAIINTGLLGILGGSFLGGAYLIGLVSVFVYDRRSEKREKEDYNENPDSSFSL